MCFSPTTRAVSSPSGLGVDARQVDVATPERVLPLHMAAQFAHVEATAALVAAGADLAAVNTDGFGVLHAAAIGGSARLVDALLAAGVRRSPLAARK